MIEILKRYRVPLFLVVVAIIIYRLFFYGQNAPAGKAQTAGIERFPYPTDRLSESHSDYILAEVQAGRIDLALELVRLRRDCAGEVDEQGCNERIRKMIQNLPGKDKQRLGEIFEQYLQFEAKMRQNLPENFASLSNQEKYRLMKKARRDFFGEDTAKLIFGVEEARVALTEEQAKFNSPEYANLPVEERLRLYEERKKEILGGYHQAHIEREPADIKYGTDLMLHQSDLAKMPESERKRVESELRVKYFGAAQAQKMEQEEKQLSQQDSEAIAKMDQFLAAEREYLKNNPNLSEEQRRSGVEDLRKRIIGK